MEKDDFLKRLGEKHEKHSRLAEQSGKILENAERNRNLSDAENRILARYDSIYDYWNFYRSIDPLHSSCDIYDKISELSAKFYKLADYDIDKLRERVRDRKITKEQYDFLMEHTPKELMGRRFEKTNEYYEKNLPRHHSCLFIDD